MSDVLNIHQHAEQKVLAALQTIEGAISENREKIQAIVSREIELKSKIAFIENEINTLEIESKQYIHQNKDTGEEMIRLKSAYEQLKSQYEDKNLILNDLRQSLAELCDTRDKRIAQRNDAKLELLSLANRLENVENDVRRSEYQFKENDIKLTEHKAEILQIHEDIRNLEKEMYSVRV